MKQNVFVVGIDPDAEGVAFSLFQNGAYSRHFYVQRRKKKKKKIILLREYDKMIRKFFRFLRGRANAGDVVRVFQEDVFSGRNVRGYSALSVVKGELLLLARMEGFTEEYDIFTVFPRTWQTQILVSGNVHRATYTHVSRARAERLVGGEVDTDHECDAINIGVYGVANIGAFTHGTA